MNDQIRCGPKWHNFVLTPDAICASSKLHFQTFFPGLLLHDTLLDQPTYPCLFFLSPLPGPMITQYIMSTALPKSVKSVLGFVF